MVVVKEIQVETVDLVEEDQMVMLKVMELLDREMMVVTQVALLVVAAVAAKVLLVNQQQVYH